MRTTDQYRPDEHRHTFDKEGHCRDCGDPVEVQHRAAHECGLRRRDFGRIAAIDFSDE